MPINVNPNMIEDLRSRIEVKQFICDTAKDQIDRMQAALKILETPELFGKWEECLDGWDFVPDKGYESVQPVLVTDAS